MAVMGKLLLQFLFLRTQCCQRSARAILFALILLVVLQAGVSAEVIRSFDEDITLNKDCSLDVTENIKMDFDGTYKHGILRWIPVEYKRHGGAYTLDLHVVSVTDEADHPYSYQTSRMHENLNIKIGSPDVTVNGVHVYRIHYTVRRAVNFFSNAPEVYWNVTGNESPFETQKVSARFHPPPGVSLSDIRTACYVGPQGSTAPGKIEKKNDEIVYSAHALKPGEGLTIVAGLPEGSVDKPTLWQEFLWFFVDWWPLFIFPIGTAYLLFIVWWHSGRDEGGGQAVAVEWNPPKDLTPAEVGTLVDESCDMQDIVSTLIDLAARGYLKIKEIDTCDKFLFFSNKDYQFTKLDPPQGEENLLVHEKLFLSGLFGFSSTSTLLSEQKHRFYENIGPIRKAIYGALIEKGHFKENPETVRNSYVGMGGIVVVLGIAAFFVPQIAIGCGLVISGLITICTARAMPARTRSGSEKLREILGFERFIRLTEKRRIAELAKNDPTIFGRLLPYAMVLGVADKWAEAFHDLLTEPPDWYEPYGYGPNYVFSSCGFVNDLGGAMNTMGNTFASGPPPSSSTSGAGGGFSGFDIGGGFSGGGFGGGGTGSW